MRVFLLLAGIVIASLAACEPGTKPLGLGDGSAPPSDAGGPPDAAPAPTCAVDNGGCDPAAECTEPSSGRVQCTCPNRWIGDGQTCWEPLLSGVDAMLKADEPQPSAWYGDAVAISDDGRTVAVGATLEDGANPDAPFGGDGDAGAVHVYRRGEEGWALDARLVSPRPTSGARFGDALDVDARGTTLVVGTSMRGSVATFVREEGGWRDADELFPPRPVAAFGVALDLTPDGRYLAVGARIASVGDVAFAGAVFTFERIESGWRAVDEVTAPNPGFREFFGGDVALSADGQTLAVGANGEDSGSGGIEAELDAAPTIEESGAVYVYRDAGAGLALETFIKAPEPQARQRFGRSVALNGAGDVLAVGANGEDEGRGASYVYRHRAGVGWTSDARLDGSDDRLFRDRDIFGVDVSLSEAGDVLAVGASNEDTAARGVAWPSTTDADSVGAVFLFRRFDGAWSLDSFVKPPNAGESRRFGSNVALSSDGATLIVGDDFESSDAAGVINDPPLEDVGGTLDRSGAAHIFR